jgi:hypothetical protein
VPIVQLAPVAVITAAFAHERVGLEQVVADGREEDVLGALDVERGT